MCSSDLRPEPFLDAFRQRVEAQEARRFRLFFLEGGIQAECLAGDPPEFARVAKLMTTNNPKLARVIPSHMRPDAPILADGKRELDKLGLGALMFVPEVRRAYEYP